MRNLSALVSRYKGYLTLDSVFFSIICFVIILSPYFRHLTKWLFFAVVPYYAALYFIKRRTRSSGKSFSAVLIDVPLALFLAACVAAVFFSQSIYHSQKIFFYRYGTYLLAFWVGTRCLSGGGAKLRALSFSVILCGLILGAGGVRDIILYRPERLFTVYGLAIPFNMLSLFITYLIPLNFALFLFSKDKTIRSLSAVATALLIPCFIVQGGRGAWVAVFISLLFIGFLKSRKIFFAIALFFFSIFLAGLFLPGVSDRIGTIPYPSQWSYRTPLFDVALKMFSDHPVIGVGLGMFEKLINTAGYTLPPDYPYTGTCGGLYIHAHSVYFELLAETGITGFLCFIGLFASYFILFAKVFPSTRDDDERSLSAGMAAMILGTLIYGVAASIILVGINETIMFWLIFGMSVHILRGQILIRYKAVVR